MQVILRNLAETQTLAQTIAPQLRGGDVLCLTGELGAGKTAFTKALAKALGVKTMVRSPSFNLLKTYPLPAQPNRPQLLVHLDCYRLSQPQEAVGLGLSDYLSNPQALIIIEWPEKILTQLPKNRIKMIRFLMLSENEREITLPSSLLPR